MAVIKKHHQATKNPNREIDNTFLVLTVTGILFALYVIGVDMGLISSFPF